MAESQEKGSTVPNAGDTTKSQETVNQPIAENVALDGDLGSVDQTRLMSCFHPFQGAGTTL